MSNISAGFGQYRVVLLVSSFALVAECVHAAVLAGVAQLVEQLICNHQVVGSSPITGSI